MQLSGTSFSAPVVAGAAAMLLAQHPTWTPDQVKGALMATATPTPARQGHARRRRGQHRRCTGDQTIPPNPNAGLDQFVTTAARRDARRSTPRLAERGTGERGVERRLAWSDVAWSDAAWSDVAWSDVAWADAAWASAAWGDAAWSDAAWSDAAWADAAWADGRGRRHGCTATGHRPADADTAREHSASPIPTTAPRRLHARAARSAAVTGLLP